ncbi:DNA-cytosine methyltransferase [Methylopila sp. Yamaguchi]|nr:DNA-cytosine methyltransferase [Methylopila sp. Yamaguchi]
MKGLDDPRGQLFKEFVRIAAETRPRFILFENVAGLVTAKGAHGDVGGILREIQSEFENLGYACRFDLLNAADFGAAQRRVRLYMIAAYKETPPHFPLPSHCRDGSQSLSPWRTLGQFLAAQRAPDAADVVRPKGRRVAELMALKPGTGLRSVGLVEANRPSGHWGYRQDCFVADLTVPSRTIRAASTPDWLRTSQADLRRLTWRECAGLQGFPTDWVFDGRSLASRFRQIGNAVQGDIGRAIGRELFAAAHSVGRGNGKSVGWPSCFSKRVRYTEMEEITNGAHRRAAREKLNGKSAEMVG